MKKVIKPIPQPKWQDPKWVYVPAVATNVLQRLKDFGFVPPSEAKKT
jgi:hypothetical protein